MKAKIKRTIKNIVFGIDAVLCKVFLNGMVLNGKYTEAHISIDDVSFSEDIESKDLMMMQELTRWNREFGLKVHLYLFYQNVGSESQIRKLSALNGNSLNKGGSTWVTIAPHEPEYIEILTPLIEANCLSSSVRFHGYKATAREIHRARDYGMNVYLCCDDSKRISYDMT